MIDRLSAAGDLALRSALAFVRGEEQPVTADELAAREGIHRNVARARLERLARAGLLETDVVRGGVGRPAKTYRASPELTAIEFPAHHYEDLVALLAIGRDDLHSIGTAFGARIAKKAGLRGRRNLQDVAAGLRRLGFQASCEDDVIVTPACPLRPIVAAHPELAEIDEGMWTALAGEGTSCATAGCLDPSSPCRVRVSIESRR